MRIWMPYRNCFSKNAFDPKMRLLRQPHFYAALS